MYEMKKSENYSQNHSKSAKNKENKNENKYRQKSTWYGVVKNCRSC